MAGQSDIVDSSGAAKALGVSLRRVQQLIQSGRLPASKMGGSYIIRRIDLDKVADRHPGRPVKSDKPKRKGK